MSINDFRLYGSNKKAQGSINLSEDPPVEEEVAASVEPEEEAPELEDLPVPTSASRKSDIAHFLTTTEGFDPDDLVGMTKAELLELVPDQE